ncbi:methylated-DNA--[protein]-cysteine S-methyltransferase [Aureitalea marina]|uniref:Methylated-DNA--protein-cysteine methyltransferase n=1 Tax=Aureitalea marina TaxID=930804 RepID=A0A2S7KK19_9FLAO|nr:methylated-DNA--[protein]-cysteine S-methyltransferase [Aureitalea marina]PQB02961.1 cysteine methyltransferase [Aureitalea marina]PQB02966.1 cysteine methyltransferase [Aureitalea marina]PQB05534.1 cysteine methyltransferase [Aureitalea marina]
MERTRFETPLGPMILEMDDSGIQLLEFTEKSITPTNTSPSEELQKAIEQIRDYFDGKRSSFDLALAPKGTDFQRKVWQELINIPYGKTISYQELANRLGDPLVIRAAASANGRNPIAVIIPCHRVIGSDGSLTGYAGGLHRKKWLVEHEQPYQQGNLFE